MTADRVATLNLPWHEPLWQQIARARAADRVAHGLLICGAPGVGKRHFARRLAQSLLCRTPAAAGDACGECAGCRQWTADTHPDVSWLVPDEAGKQIRVAPVRAFTRTLQLTAQYDTGRLGWIDPAQALSISAANSLLKTLEEPPAGTHLILISDRADALMATIRSRCQILRVPPADIDMARQWLSGQGVAPSVDDAEALRTPLRLAAYQEREYDRLAKEWQQGLTQLLAGRADAVQLAETWCKQAADLWLDWLYRTTCLLLQQRLTDDARIPDDAFTRAAATLDTSALRWLGARVTRVARLAETNADWQLVIESLLLEFKACQR